MYTLILTIVMWKGDYRYALATSVDSVSGFTTAELCVKAGDEWVRQMKSMKPWSTAYRATCVRTSP